MAGCAGAGVDVATGSAFGVGVMAAGDGCTATGCGAGAGDGGGSTILPVCRVMSFFTSPGFSSTGVCPGMRMKVRPGGGLAVAGCAGIEPVVDRGPDTASF